jgi:predicted DNA-binding transcriptional regulator YafY
VKPPRKRPKPKLTPSQRRDQLKILLRSGWLTSSEIIERLGVGRSTAFRLLKEVGETEPVESDEIEGKTRWRLPHGSRDEPLRISTSQMVAFTFVRSALGFLRGTGLDDDLVEVFDRLSHALKKSDYELSKNLDRKLFDVNEASYDYSDKIDVVNDVITALLREERITCTRAGGARTKIDPYTLVLYKKGLYLLGHSHEHKATRSFGLDKIVDTERHAGERFDYPDDFDPAAHVLGPFGLIRGPRQRVVVRFDAKVAHYVKRRRWHATQAFRDVDGGIEMTIEPEGTDEMVSWVLGFGATAEVIAPRELRERVAKEMERACARYGRGEAAGE